MPSQILPGTTPSGGEVAQTSPKLVKSAREFEALLLQSWLEEMNQAFVGSEESLDPGHDTINSLGTQAIASALVERGGIGIAKALIQKLQPGDNTKPGGSSHLR